MAAVLVGEGAALLAAEFGVDLGSVALTAATDILGEETVATLSNAYSTVKKAIRIATSVGSIAKGIKKLGESSWSKIKTIASGVKTFGSGTTQNSKSITSSNVKSVESASAGVTKWHEAAIAENRISHTTTTTQKRSQPTSRDVGGVVHPPRKVLKVDDPRTTPGDVPHPGKTIGNGRLMKEGVHYQPPPRSNEQPALTLPPMETADAFIKRGTQGIADHGPQKQLFQKGMERQREMMGVMMDGKGMGAGLPRMQQTKQALRDQPFAMYNEMVDVMRSGTRYTHNVTPLPMGPQPNGQTNVGERKENPNFPKAMDGTTLAPDLLGMGTWPTHASLTDGHTGPIAFGANQIGANNPDFSNFSGANLMAL